MVFRKRRRPTPNYKVPPPYSPFTGDHAELNQSGTHPFCAMFQVAAEDLYADYVVCRGFDTRILRFVDYAAGDPNKPGIPVAKPFGKRTTGTYEIGEVYPAFLPTQGNAELNEFKQGSYFPPSPVAVKWRVGQNPGVAAGGLDGGQPAELSDEIGVLRDHNGKVVNWLLIDSKGGGDDHFLFTLAEDMTGSSALAEIRTLDDMSQVESSHSVVNTLSDFSHLMSADRGICVRIDGVYYAVHPEAPGGGGGVTAGHVVTLNGKLDKPHGSTASATIIRSGESGKTVSDIITVLNTGDKVGYTGAVGWAVKIGLQYWLVEIDQYPLQSVVVFSNDTHDFSGAGTRQGKGADQRIGGITVSSWKPHSPYPFSFLPDPLPSIANPYNLLGLKYDSGIVVWNDSYEDTENSVYGRFELIEVLPLTKRKLQFRLTSDMDSVRVASVQDFEIVQTREYTAGEVAEPVPKYLYDVMKLVIDGKSGDLGECEYSYREENWQITAFKRREFGWIRGTLTSLSTKVGGPYDGLKAAQVNVKVTCPDFSDLIGTSVEVIDHIECVLDLPEEDLVGVFILASECVAESLSSGASPGDLTPVHWGADDRCCSAADNGGV